jgi:SAM-dependent methyltransferase
MSRFAPQQPMPAREAYRLWAPEYDATPNPLLSLEQRCLAPLTHSAVGCDVVDLGCGTGRWLEQIATVGARSMTGVDVSSEMLEYARTKLGAVAHLVRADCMDTPLAPSSSDWVIASFLVSYISDIHRFAVEAARITRPGALMVVSDVHPATLGYGWKRTFRNALQSIEIQTYPYELPELHNAMEEAGFDSAFFREVLFDQPEKDIFLGAGRPDLFTNVEGLPVLYISGYRRSTE